MGWKTFLSYQLKPKNQFALILWAIQIMWTWLEEEMETHQDHLRRWEILVMPSERKRERERWRNPLNSLEILSKCVVYTTSFGEKYYYTERFSTFWISTCVDTERGLQKQDNKKGREKADSSLSSCNVFLCVCRFPRGHFSKNVHSWKKKIVHLWQKLQHMNSRCFSSWHSWVQLLQKLCSHLFSIRGLYIDWCALAHAGFRYFRALFGALLWQRRGRENTVRIVISYVAHGCLCPVKQTEIISMIVALMRLCVCVCFLTLPTYWVLGSSF